MAGNREQGLRAAATIKQQYGADFYQKIGAIGGKKGHTGGFLALKETDPNRLREISVKGGKLGKRRKKEL